LEPESGEFVHAATATVRAAMTTARITTFAMVCAVNHVMSSETCLGRQWV
jgi:hypothetical protein